MSRELKSLSTALRAEFTAKRGDYFLCPDGVPRKMHDATVADDFLVMEMDPVLADTEAMLYKWPIQKARESWKLFQKISRQQAEERTKLPAVRETMPTPVPSESTPVAAPFQTYLMGHIDPDRNLESVATGLMYAFDKVKTDAAYVNQATAMEKTAKSIIDVYKTKIEAVKAEIDLRKLELLA